MRKTFLVLLFLFPFLVGCTQEINEIQNEEYVGETVNIQGTVQDSIKIGGLSGFTVVDESGNSIRVSSESLPAVGEEIRVEGTLMKDTIFGYYIERK